MLSWVLLPRFFISRMFFCPREFEVCFWVGVSGVWVHLSIPAKSVNTPNSCRHHISTSPNGLFSLKKEDNMGFFIEKRKHGLLYWRRPNGFSWQTQDMGCKFQLGFFLLKKVCLCGIGGFISLIMVNLLKYCPRQAKRKTCFIYLPFLKEERKVLVLERKETSFINGQSSEVVECCWLLKWKEISQIKHLVPHCIQLPSSADFPSLSHPTL